MPVCLVFRPPTQDVLYPFPDFPALVIKQTEGISVVLENGVAYETKYPDSDRLALADRYWLGGYEHPVDDADAVLLTSLGYGDYLYECHPGTGYGEGGYGMGGYGA